LLAHWLAQGRPDPAALLERCGSSWSESFKPGSPDLPGLKRAIAESPLLATIRDDPETWFHRLAEIRRTLDRATDSSDRFDPEGLVPCVVAYTTRVESHPHVVWAIRTHLLNNEAGWRALAEDLRLNLADAEPSSSPAVVDRWDRALSSLFRERFWEVVLNVADGPRLASIVSVRADDLPTLGPLSWWAHSRYPESRDDLRDAFARLVPLAPLDESAVMKISAWMNSSRGSIPVANGPRAWLSPLGLARWTCIERLTIELYRSRLDDRARRFNLVNWCQELPLASLAEDDRYRFVAATLDTDRVGKWLVRSELTQLDRITGWANELEGLIDVSSSVIPDRNELAFKLRREMSLVIDDIGESERARFLTPPPFD